MFRGLGCRVASLHAAHTYAHRPCPPVSLSLSAPQRVCGADTPFPLAMEKIYLPDELKVFDAIKKAVEF